MSSNKENYNRNGSGVNSTLSQNRPMAFSIGAITRLKVKNFLTYTEMELKPGPNLNLIIGPNGTGKSTIVCAICLGLGGKPSVLGRAGNIEEYIQYEKEKALIEIDLYHSSSEIVRITREINKSGTSQWTINCKASSQKNVEATVRQLNIQVDNLCQFLPQDRVADFVKMTPQELLANTQKAVGNMKMFEKFTKLKELRVKHRELEGESRTDEEQLRKEVEKNDSLENAVKTYAERETFLETIDLLKKKRKWVEYSAKREEFNGKKVELNEAEEVLKASKDKDKPYRKRVEESEAKELKINGEQQKAYTKYSSLLKKVKEQKTCIENLGAKLAQVERDLNNKKEDENNRLKRVQDYENQLRLLNVHLDKLPTDTTNIQVQLQNLQTTLSAITKEIAFLENDKGNKKAEIEALKRDTNASNRLLIEENNTNDKKLEILRQRNNHAYQATVWLRRNRDRFRAEVYEPIMLNINMHDPKNAKYLECQIANRDMFMFLFEDANDLEIFMKIISDEKKLKVNTGLVPNQTMESYKPESPIVHYSRWGFTHYLIDLFTAPDGVLRYLCKFYSLHKVPVGNHVTANCIEKVLNDTKFTLFYTPDRRFQIRQSKHGNRVKSTMSFELGQPSFLTISMNKKLIEDLQTKIKRNGDKITELQNVVEELRDTEEEKKKTLEELRENKRKLQSAKELHKNLTTQINQKKATIETLNQNVINLEEEVQKTGVKIQKICSLRHVELKKFKSLLREILDLSKSNIEIGFKVYFASKLKSKAKEEYEAIALETNRLQEQVTYLQKVCSDFRLQAKRLLDIAKQATGIDANQNLSQVIKDKFGVLPNSLEDIDGKIKQEQARADLICPVDVAVIEEYESRKKRIENMKKSFDEIETKQQKYKAEINEISQEWIPEIEGLLTGINTNFSLFFSRLQCVGEVSLKKADNVLDFDKYGVCIKVKFRDSEVLHELTASHQSGGEKSVSTVLYMMALQELTSVPFRCVDEINQGMDSKNERKVFEFIVETACRTTSQYFLLTPKLLPDLAYSSQMKIHVIANGKEVHMKSNSWDVKGFIKRARKMK